MTDVSKYCRECKWQKVSLIDRLSLGAACATSFAKCLHESALQTDPDRLHADTLVTGALRKLKADEYTFCSVNRLHKCGSEGKFWESRR